MRWIRTTNRIVAASLAVALLGGGVAYASSEGAGDAEDAKADTAVETTDTSVAPEAAVKAGLPDGLVEALEAYREAVREWRHCIIDLVSGDLPAETTAAETTEADSTEAEGTETATCGPAPAAGDYGLGEADLLAYDLDERLATRIESKLTRVEIRTTCLAELAAEGRSAVMECVMTALKAEFGDRVRPIDQRRNCRPESVERTGNTVAAPATGAQDTGCEGQDAREVRGDRGDRNERTDRATTGGRTGDDRSGS